MSLNIISIAQCKFIHELNNSLPVQIPLFRCTGKNAHTDEVEIVNILIAEFVSTKSAKVILKFTDFYPH